MTWLPGSLVLARTTKQPIGPSMTASSASWRVMLPLHSTVMLSA